MAAGTVGWRRNDHHALNRHHVFAGCKAAVFGISGPADAAGAVFVFSHCNQKALPYAAFVASARRYAVSAYIAQEHAHETAYAGIGPAPHAHHALPVIE